MQLTNEDAHRLITLGLMAGHGCTPQQAQQSADEWMVRFDAEAQTIGAEHAIALVESRANRTRKAATRAGAIPLTGGALDAWRALMAAVKDIRGEK